jgi:fermentation-respiration switch protein FrsA (DUF1100 family)
MLFNLLLIPVVGYVGIAVALFFAQSRLVHLPEIPGRTLTATPQTAGIDYQSVDIITADDVKLHGWFVTAEPARATLLFFHGNAGNISHRIDSLRIFHDLGLSTLIIDYRGYGQSEGKPSEQGLYADSEAAWRYLMSERGIPPRQIIIFGRSLGGAVAAWLAARHQPRMLILESTFTSAPDMAAELYPFLPTHLLTRLQYDTRSNLERVSCPVLIVHSRDDEIIPFQHGQRLYDTAREPKRLLEIRGDHNMGFLLDQVRYEAELAAFLEEHL